MKVKITAVPLFHVDIDKDTLKALIVCAQNHYDSTCRAAAQQGGVLFSWANTLKFRANSADPVLPVGTFRELDLTLKIAEGSRYLLDDAHQNLVARYAMSVRIALQKSNEVTSNVCAEVNHEGR